jgi:hypothetical protein
MTRELIRLQKLRKQERVRHNDKTQSKYKKKQLNLYKRKVSFVTSPEDLNHIK